MDSTWLKKILDASPVPQKKKILELLKVYSDLERTLAGLRGQNGTRRIPAGRASINITKLIRQLSRSKRQIERKLGNTYLLEKKHLKEKLLTLTASLTARDRRA